MENQAVNNLAAGAEGFNDSIRQTTLQAADNMAKNFSDAFGTQQQKATAAAAGPIASALRDAIARAQANATSTSVAKPQTLTDKGPQPFTGTSAAELRATDSRSREGVAEMFRLMRGEQNDIPQKSLDMLTQIHLDLMEHGDGMLVEIGAN